MSYLDKYRGQGDRRSIYDILSLNPNNETDWETIKNKYRATDIDKVVIGGNTFTNYGDFQFVWEKSYVKSPERSADGSIGNLNSYATFVTPHLILNFAVMSIDDYRKIMRLDLEANEFVVECYDPIYNKKFKGKMYFGTPQMAKLFKLAKIRFDGERWEEFVELVGVQEYTVELIGTNADLDLVGVRYNVNPPEGKDPSVTDGGEDDVYKGEEIIIGSNTDIPTETFEGQYKFKEWNEKADGSGQVYTNGYSYTVNHSIVLYAQWEETSNHTLSFNYGVAHDLAEQRAYETSRKVVEREPIGNLPAVENPTVIAEDVYGDEQEYRPYSNGRWHKSPNRSGEVLTSMTPYWTTRDTSAYLVYVVATYTLSLFVDNEKYNETISIQYDTPMNLPVPIKAGKVFDGWYTEEGTKKEGNMPPYNLILYARWLDK